MPKSIYSKSFNVAPGEVPNSDLSKGRRDMIIKSLKPEFTFVEFETIRKLFS